MKAPEASLGEGATHVRTRSMGRRLQGGGSPGPGKGPLLTEGASESEQTLSLRDAADTSIAQGKQFCSWAGSRNKARGPSCGSSKRRSSATEMPGVYLHRCWARLQAFRRRLRRDALNGILGVPCQARPWAPCPAPAAHLRPCVAPAAPPQTTPWLISSIRCRQPDAASTVRRRRWRLRRWLSNLSRKSANPLSSPSPRLQIWIV